MGNARKNPKDQASAVDKRDSQLPQALVQVRLSPRHSRLLTALLAGPRSRKDVDAITGAANGPDEVLQLRRRYALRLPCARRPGFDRDGRPVEAGVYRLTAADRNAALQLLNGVHS
jgi:hypothetical protein